VVDKQGSRHKAAEIATCAELPLAAQPMCLEAMTGCGQRLPSLAVAV
jgi:hypothetical protein